MSVDIYYLKKIKRRVNKLPVKVRDLINKKIPMREKILREEILEYLQKNKDTAFTSKDLQNKFEKTSSQINTRLNTMKRRGEVKHMGMYWFVKRENKRGKSSGRKVANKKRGRSKKK